MKFDDLAVGDHFFFEPGEGPEGIFTLYQKATVRDGTYTRYGQDTPIMSAYGGSRVMRVPTNDSQAIINAVFDHHLDHAVHQMIEVNQYGPVLAALARAFSGATTAKERDVGSYLLHLHELNY